MDEDPAFYKQFSELLEETIRGYREKRISEKDYLNNVIIWQVEWRAGTMVAVSLRASREMKMRKPFLELWNRRSRWRRMSALSARRVWRTFL